MSRRRRLALAALAALAVALIVAPAALAAAGGGSSGFSGGGEGGGGGGHGSGFALFILIRLLIDIAVLGHGLGALFLIALGFLFWFVTRGLPKLQAWWAERAAQRGGGHHKTSKRERRVELAAAEAAEEDPDFAPDRIRAAGRNRLVYRDGVPLAVREGDFVRELTVIDPAIAPELRLALRRSAHKGLTHTI